MRRSPAPRSSPHVPPTAVATAIATAVANPKAPDGQVLPARSSDPRPCVSPDGRLTSPPSSSAMRSTATCMSPAWHALTASLAPASTVIIPCAAAVATGPSARRPRRRPDGPVITRRSAAPTRCDGAAVTLFSASPRSPAASTWRPTVAPLAASPATRPRPRPPAPRRTPAMPPRRRSVTAPRRHPAASHRRPPRDRRSDRLAPPRRALRAPSGGLRAISLAYSRRPSAARLTARPRAATGDNGSERVGRRRGGRPPRRPVRESSLRQPVWTQPRHRHRRCP